MNILDDIQIYTNTILGKGTYSNVYLGKYKNNNVAIKIILTQNLNNNIVIRLKKELDVIKILQRNDNINIGSYYKILQIPNKIFIVMELYPDGELSQYIKSGLDLNTVSNYYTQILNGYKHLLSCNIIHRDIKSQNIMLSNGIIKIIDFGLSKTDNINLNETICGSPLYMAPELLNNDTYTSKSDIWSLGILLYEMIYGITPYHKYTKLHILKHAINNNNIHYPEMSYNNIYNVPTDIINYMKKLLHHEMKTRIEWNEVFMLWDNINKEYTYMLDKTIMIEPNILYSINENYFSLDVQIKPKITQPIKIIQNTKLKYNIIESISLKDIQYVNNNDDTCILNNIAYNNLTPINNISNIIVANTPTKYYEYIKNHTKYVTSYVYSKSQ